MQSNRARLPAWFGPEAVWSFAGHFPLAFLAEGRVPAAGYSALLFRPCSGVSLPKPDFTHANANRQSLGRFDGRAAVGVERYERIEVMATSRERTVCHKAIPAVNSS